MHVSQEVHENTIFNIEKGITPGSLEIQRVLKEVNFGTLCYEKGISRTPFVPRGFCIAALHAVLLLEEQDSKRLLDFLAKHRLNPKTNPQVRAKAIQRAYALAKRALKRK